MLKKYLAYIKDNPEGYWFKRKLYGWGWTPVTREGWFVIGVYILFVVNFVRSLHEAVPVGEKSVSAVVPIILATVILLVICYKKGERPRWQWGIK